MSEARTFLRCCARRGALTLAALMLAAGLRCGATPAEQSARALIARLMPGHAREIDVAEIAPAPNGADVFEVESVGGRLVLRGNSGVSIASALGYYLAQVGHRQLSWEGDTLDAPGRLPPVPSPVRIVSPYKYRAYLNYCTFNYTMSWWNRARWEREIDWMALHGVTMPLATTGQEAVWQATLRQFGMTDDEIRAFLVGPAYSCWQWLTNIEQWAGPLPQSWIDSHLALGRFILDRERELGMTPILQGFSGCVPLAIVEKFPGAAIQHKKTWCEVPPGTAQIDPEDPLFEKMGRVFLEKQRELLGVGHLYAADPFHEGEPPKEGAAYLNSVGARIFALTNQFDPRATLVMQGWTIREDIVRGIPEDRLLVLDLTGAKWRETKAFWGRPWVAGVLHNFGGRSFLGGNLPGISSNGPSRLSDPTAGKIVGIGAFPEAIEQNPIVYDLAFSLAWQRSAPDLKDWVRTYVSARYGSDEPHAQKAWAALRDSVYAQAESEPSMESPITAVPALSLEKASAWGTFDRNYDVSKVWLAWEDLLAASDHLEGVDAYRYDVVDVARQGLSDLSLPLYSEAVSAFKSGKKARFKAAAANFLELCGDMDTLLKTRREFLLGKWLGDARLWAENDSERLLYEKNARLLVTIWGPPGPEAFLKDYSWREWSGLIGGFYVKRWEQYFAFLETQQPGYSEAGLHRVMGRVGDRSSEFYSNLSAWEYAWCDGHERYPATAQGDSIQVARSLLMKWRPVMKTLYPGYTWVKPVAPVKS